MKENSKEQALLNSIHSNSASMGDMVELNEHIEFMIDGCLMFNLKSDLAYWAYISDLFNDLLVENTLKLLT